MCLNPQIALKGPGTWKTVLAFFLIFQYWLWLCMQCLGRELGLGYLHMYKASSLGPNLGLYPCVFKFGDFVDHH